MLIQDLLRIIVVRAIRGHTWAGEAVFDSPSNVADIQVQGERQTYIAVYCDEMDVEQQTEGSMDGAGDEGVIRLVIEVGVARATEVSAEDAGGTGTRLEATDEALELQMGFIMEQAKNALTSVNEAQPWSELFRLLTAGKIRLQQIRRGGPSQDESRPAQRFASRVLILSVSALAEPARGADLEDHDAFWRLIQMFKADEALMGVGELVEQMWRGRGELTEAELARKYLHVPAETVAAIGIAPPPPLTSSERPGLTKFDMPRALMEYPRPEKGGSHLGEDDDG